MGGTTFEDIGYGATAQSAFNELVQQACHDNGYSGYTGTIAEKSDFIMIQCPKGRNYREYAEELIDKDDHRISSKWGPAGCILIEEAYKITQAEEVKTAKVTNHPATKSKEWATFYVLYASQREISMFSTKADALKEAKRKAIELKKEISIHVEKRVTNVSNIAAIVSPVVELKPVKNPWNKYYFFGWASC